MAVGYAVENISNLPFGHIIGGPLLAAIDAQAQAAKATMDFIMEVGFFPDPPAAGAQQVLPDVAGNAQAVNAGQVRMVTFRYLRPAPPTVAIAAANNNGDDDDGNEGNNNDAVANAVQIPQGYELAEIQVPLLTIVPIPYFAIDEMNIDFMAKITEAITSEKNQTNQNTKSGSMHAKAGWGPVSGGMKGSLSSKHSSSSSTSSKYQTELTMNVRVRASQNDMPAGLSAVLRMLSDNVKSGSAVA